MSRRLNDTETCVVAALERAHTEREPWIGEYDELYDRVCREWVRLYPGRRNRPTARALRSALARLTSEEKIEDKSVGVNEFTTQRYFRIRIAREGERSPA